MLRWLDLFLVSCSASVCRAHGAHWEEGSEGCQLSPYNSDACVVVAVPASVPTPSLSFL